MTHHLFERVKHVGETDTVLDDIALDVRLQLVHTTDGVGKQCMKYHFLTQGRQSPKFPIASKNEGTTHLCGHFPMVSLV
jgi:hypothetical protein